MYALHLLYTWTVEGSCHVWGACVTVNEFVPLLCGQFKSVVGMEFGL